MSPDGGRGFAEKLDGLLAAVPRTAGTPGEGQRFTTTDVVTTLASFDQDVSETAASRAAEEWLEAMRAGTRSERDARYLRALEDLFRVSPGYFVDDLVAAQVDARIAFTADVNARGIRFIGPCRAPSMDVQRIHDLHVILVDALDRHGSPP